MAITKIDPQNSAARRERFVGAALLGGLALACVAGCSAEGARAASRRTLVLTGSSTVAPLAAELGKRYEASHPGVRIDVQTGGSSRGLADVRSGLADIGMVSRALGPGEDDLIGHVIARDGIALVVHAENSVRALTEEQVRGIYTGEIESWTELGGADGPITVVHKAEGRSTLEVFLAHYGLGNSSVRPDVVIGDNEQGILTVAGNRGAIGYVSIGAAERAASDGVALRLLPVDGVEATLANVAGGRFPMARPLTLVTSGVPEQLAAEFLAFARSPDAHDSVRSQLFVPLADG